MQKTGFTIIQTPKVKKNLPWAGTFIRAPPFEFFSTNIDFRLCCRQDSCLNYTFFIFLPIVALLGWMDGWLGAVIIIMDTLNLENIQQLQQGLKNPDTKNI